MCPLNMSQKLSAKHRFFGHAYRCTHTPYLTNDTGYSEKKPLNMDFMG